MNAKKLQSLSAAVLLTGCIFVALGGLGSWYFNSNPAPKNTQKTFAEQSATPAPQTPFPVPSQTPAKIDAPLAATPPKATPALITSGSTPVAAAPAATPSKSGTAWTLDPSHRQQIIAILGNYGGKSITICSVESDADGLAFAGTLKRVFSEAGWHVDGVKQIPSATHLAGLNLAAGSFPSPESLVAAYHAFTSAGFKVSQQLDAKLTGGQVELIVGAAK